MSRYDGYTEPLEVLVDILRELKKLNERSEKQTEHLDQPTRNKETPLLRSRTKRGANK